MTNPALKAPATALRIESWKAIASYFDRDERTVKRWEREHALPVHRRPGERGGVFAYTDQLEAWRHARQTVPPEDTLPAGSANEHAEFDHTSGSFVSVQPATAEPLAEPAPAVTQEATPPRRVWPALLGLIAVAALLLVTPAARHRLLVLKSSARPADSLHQGSRPSINKEAEEAYLMGRYHLNRRTGESLNLAIDDFTQAVVHDPAYANAYAGLAQSYALLPQYGSMPRDQAFPRALAAAQTAIRLDPTSSEAYRSLGFATLYWQWNVPRALQAFQKAIELAPQSVEPHHWYATALFSLQRFPEAQEEITRARRLDPTSRSVLTDEALILAHSARSDEGIRRLTQMQNTEPDFVSPPRYLREIFFEKEDFPDFLISAHRAAQITHAPEEIALAEVAERGWRRAGRQGLLLAVRQQQQRVFNMGQSSGFDLALTCAHLGLQADAVSYLQAAFRANEFRLMSLSTFGFSDILGSYPPYQQLQAQIQARMYPPPE